MTQSHDPAHPQSGRRSKAFGYAIGPIILIDGCEYEFLNTTSKGTCVFRAIADYSVKELTHEQFLGGYGSGAIRIPRQRRKQDSAETQEHIEFSEINLDGRDEAMWRAHYVREHLKLPRRKTTRRQRRDAIRVAEMAAKSDESLSAEFRAAEAPSISRVYEWVNDWDPTIGPLSLLPKRSNSGRRKAVYHPVFESIIQAGLDDYIGTANIQRADVIEVVLDEFDKAKKKDPGLRAENTPSPSTVARRFRDLGGETIMAIEEGTLPAYRAYNPVQKGIDTDIPLERVEIDTTLMDVNVRDLTGTTILGRPYLTIAIDCATRVIIGFEVSLTRPNSDDVCRLLRRSFLPKDQEKLAEKGVEHPCLACGVPAYLVFDNGLEFIAANTKAHLKLLDIAWKILPPKSPHMKARIERVFQTLNRLGIHAFPGTTRSNPKKRGDRKPELDNLLTISEIEDLLTVLIYDVYHTREHRIMKCSPNAAWSAALKKHQVYLPEDHEILEEFTYTTEKRQATRQGIAIHGLHYNSKAVADICRAARGPIDVQVRYDSLDISIIHVENPKTGRWIVVPCLDKSVQGLDLRSYKLLTKYGKAKGSKEDRLAHRASRAKFVKLLASFAGPRQSTMLPRGHKRKPLQLLIADSVVDGNLALPTKRQRRKPKASVAPARHPDPAKTTASTSLNDASLIADIPTRDVTINQEA